MLVQLQIKDLAIVETLTVNFSPQFNVVTGESGSGKSIIIRALGLLIGQRAATADIRQGSDKAILTGSFRVDPDHPAVALLEKLGISYEMEDNHFLIIVRRAIYKNGRSSAWLCDIPVTLASIRSLGSFLIDICGQNESQRILNPKEQATILDSFLPKNAILGQVQQAFKKTSSSLHSLAQFIEEYKSLINDQDYWEYRSKELEELSASQAEFDKLTEVCKMAESQFQIDQKLKNAIDILDTGFEGISLAEALVKVRKILLSTSDSQIGTIGSELEKISTGLDDCSYKLNTLGTENEQKLQEAKVATKRLDLYYAIFRKIGVNNVLDLLSEAEKIFSKMALLKDAEAIAKDLVEEFYSDCQKLEKLARSLTKERKKAAVAVENKIKKELGDLDMLSSSVLIELSGIDRKVESLESSIEELLGEDISRQYAKGYQIFNCIGSQGKEGCRFLFISGAGEQPKPLESVASGGEISRIMLALKRALAAKGQTGLMVFDEIDSGISGKVADLVGRKIHNLSLSFQVICVSHLAQVAAYADRHFVIRKLAQKGRTHTRISDLTAEGRKAEIARLLSGEKVTEESLSNAHSIVSKAQKVTRHSLKFAARHPSSP